MKPDYQFTKKDIGTTCIVLGLLSFNNIVMMTLLLGFALIILFEDKLSQRISNYSERKAITILCLMALALLPLSNIKIKEEPTSTTDIPAIKNQEVSTEELEQVKKETSIKPKLTTKKKAPIKPQLTETEKLAIRNSYVMPVLWRKSSQKGQYGMSTKIITLNLALQNRKTADIEKVEGVVTVQDRVTNEYLYSTKVVFNKLLKGNTASLNWNFPTQNIEVLEKLYSTQPQDLYFSFTPKKITLSNGKVL